MHLFKGPLTAACRTQGRRMSLFRRTTTWLKLKLEISLLIEFVSLYIIWCIIVIWRTSTSWVVKRNKRNNICRTKLATIWAFWQHNMSRYESQITQKWTFDTTIWVASPIYTLLSVIRQQMSPFDPFRGGSPKGDNVPFFNVFFSSGERP